MSLAAPHHAEMQEAGTREVVDETARTDEEAAIFLAKGRGADHRPSVARFRAARR